MTTDPTRCRHCGRRGLQQRRTDARWTLHEADGRLHACTRRETVPPIPTNSLERQRNARRRKT